MELLIAPILFIGVVLYVAYPLFLDPEEDGQDDLKSADRERVLEEKENVLANLKDIEIDYQMGKLSQEDYEELKSEFELLAVGVFERLEQLSTKKRSKMKKK